VLNCTGGLPFTNLRDPDLPCIVSGTSVQIHVQGNNSKTIPQELTFMEGRPFHLFRPRTEPSIHTKEQSLPRVAAQAKQQGLLDNRANRAEPPTGYPGSEATRYHDMKLAKINMTNKSTGSKFD